LGVIELRKDGLTTLRHINADPAVRRRSATEKKNKLKNGKRKLPLLN
jgi:hypothetical protein